MNAIAVARLDEIARSVVKRGLARERGGSLRKHGPCVTGDELCAYLVETKRCVDVAEAVELGNRLLSAGKLIKVYGSRKTFANSRGLYRVVAPAPSALAAEPLNETLDDEDLVQVMHLSSKVESIERALHGLGEALQGTNKIVDELHDRQMRVNGKYVRLARANDDAMRSFMWTVMAIAVVYISVRALTMVSGWRLKPPAELALTALATLIVVTATRPPPTLTTSSSISGPLAADAVDEAPDKADSLPGSPASQSLASPGEERGTAASMRQRRSPRSPDRGESSIRSYRVGRNNVLYVDTM